MTMLPITLTASGAAALINLWLAIRIGGVRTRQKISIGDGGDAGLIAAMRAHANFVEYTPFVLILIAALELAVGQQFWLWIVGTAYMLGRLAHGLGMTGAWYNGRKIGTIVTFLVLAGLGVTAVVTPYLHRAVELHDIRTG